MADNAFPDTKQGEGRGESAPAKSRQAFRTISEVAKELGVPQHVLRFWETKFAYVKPMKRGGNRRYYRPDDVVLLRAIRHALYSEGYTIKGVQKLLKTHGSKHFVEVYGKGDGTATDMAAGKKATEGALAARTAPSTSTAGQVDGEALKIVLEELKALRRFVDEYQG